MGGTAGPRLELLVGSCEKTSWASRPEQKAQHGGLGSQETRARSLGCRGRSPRQGGAEGARPRAACAASAPRPGPGRPPGSAAGSRSPAPPVGGAALSPQPPPQPPPRPPRVPGGAAAAAAGSSMRTEPGPGHGDPQHHGPGQPSCPCPLPPSWARRSRHASPGMCGLGWARAQGSRGSRPAPRRAPLNRAGVLGGLATGQHTAGVPCSQDPRAEPLQRRPSSDQVSPPTPPTTSSAPARSLNAGSPCSRPWSRPSLAEMWRKCVPSSRRRRTSMYW